MTMFNYVEHYEIIENGSSRIVQDVWTLYFFAENIDER